MNPAQWAVLIVGAVLGLYLFVLAIGFLSARDTFGPRELLTISAKITGLFIGGLLTMFGFIAGIGWAVQALA